MWKDGFKFSIASSNTTTVHLRLQPKPSFLQLYIILQYFSTGTTGGLWPFKALTWLSFANTYGWVTSLPRSNPRIYLSTFERLPSTCYLCFCKRRCTTPNQKFVPSAASSMNSALSNLPFHGAKTYSPFRSEHFYASRSLLHLIYLFILFISHRPLVSSPIFTLHHCKSLPAFSLSLPAQPPLLSPSTPLSLRLPPPIFP